MVEIDRERRLAEESHGARRHAARHHRGDQADDAEEVAGARERRPHREIFAGDEPGIRGDGEEGRRDTERRRAVAQAAKPWREARAEHAEEEIPEVELHQHVADVPEEPLCEPPGGIVPGQGRVDGEHDQHAAERERAEPRDDRQRREAAHEHRDEVVDADRRAGGEPERDLVKRHDPPAQEHDRDDRGHQIRHENALQLGADGTGVPSAGGGEETGREEQRRHVEREHHCRDPLGGGRRHPLEDVRHRVRDAHGDDRHGFQVVDGGVATGEAGGHAALAIRPWRGPKREAWR